MKKILLFLFPLFCNYISNAQNSCNCNTTICNQIWMTHNLQTSYYRNGDRIPNVTDPATWSGLTTGAWCWYNNDSATYSVYGKLYNWYAVNDPRGLAPIAWHIPSEHDWNLLIKCIDPNADTLCTNCSQSFIAGGAMKDNGPLYWLYPNTGATNSTGFTGLPAGIRFSNGAFDANGSYTYWWSSTFTNTTDAWSHYLDKFSANAPNYSDKKSLGFSVRCVKN